MSNTPIPPNKPGGSSNGQSAPAPAQEASLTGYTPPAGEDEIVEELAEEIVDDVIEDAVVAPVQAPPPPAPVATPAPVVRAASPVPPSTPAAPIAPPAPVARVATPAPVTPPVPPAPPAGPSRADILLDSLAAEEYRRTSVAASAPIAPVAPAAPISSAQPVEPRVTYTTTPPPPSSGAGDAAPSEIVEDEVIEDAVDLGTAPAAVAPTPPPADLHVDLDEFSTAVDTAPKAPRPRTAMPKNVAPPSSLQSTSIPVLITVGLLLLGPGVWSVLILLGKTEIPGGEREDAKKMASLFWICLPMGLLLITGALYFLVQVRCHCGWLRRG